MLTHLEACEYLQWLQQGPDSRGECDDCHHERELWQMPVELDDESGGDAGWQLCAICFRRMVKSKTMH